MGCKKCFLRFVHKIFLGDYILKLVNQKDLNGDRIRDAFIGILTGIGVVAALLFSLTLGKADGATDEDWWAFWAGVCWYAATFSTAWSCYGATFVAIMISITPSASVVGVIRKLMYIFVLPAYGMVMGFGFMFFGVSVTFFGLPRRMKLHGQPCSRV